MQVHRNIEDLPKFRNAVITIGTFDGVHNGHKKIIEQLNREAKRIGGESLIITFHPHPRKIVGDTSGVKLLTTPEEKIELLEKLHVDHVVIVPFNEAFANQSAEAYVKDFLVKRFNPHTIIIGYDHKFGNGRKGDYQLLETYGKLLGFNVQEISEQILDEVVISSTQIRKALLHSDSATAAAFLGYPYFFEGSVIKGDQIGRTIGYPTANIQINNEEKLVPGDGIYAVKVQIEQQQYGGMLYIGSRPVVNGKRRVIEVNIFDFAEDIYDKKIRIQLHQYIRGDIHFTGLDALKEQLADDKIQSLKALQIS